MCSNNSLNLITSDLTANSLFLSSPLYTPPIQSNSLSANQPSPGVQEAISNLVGDRIQTAINLGDINDSSYLYVELLNWVDMNDFYQFQLGNSGTVTLTLQELDADADLLLLDCTGNLITASTALGTNNESIIRDLEAGTYYIHVNTTDPTDNIYRVDVQATGSRRAAGQTLSSAQDLGNISYKSYYVDGNVTQGTPQDYYRFELVESGTVNFQIANPEPNVNIALYNANGSLIPTSDPRTINQQLAPGKYYLRTYAASDSLDYADYSLLFSSATADYSGTRTLTGTFGADNFDVIGTYRRTVVSGKGNVNFGDGLRDRLDLSNIASTNVTINFANTQGGGQLYNPGNGMRLFDSLQFSDGRYVLFEGIDEIRFSDRTINLAITPNDPLFNQQWNLHMMGVQNAWRFTTGSSQVMVGIEDTGLALTSQGFVPSDLRTTLYSDRNDFADDFVDQNGITSLSHGTAVQSIIAADTNNGIGMSGINWSSDIYTTDVLGGNSDDLSLPEAAQEMIDSASRRGQRLVINMSLRSNRISTRAAFEAVVAANPDVLFVIAAGNDGDVSISGLAYPASLAQQYRNVIAVGASWGDTDYDGRARTPGTRIEYPDWWGSQYGPGLTVMGPSEVTARNIGPYSFNDYIDDFNGTSAAAPNVAGVASLLWSANPNLSAAQINQILSQTATDLGQPGYDIYYGNGFVDADAAVRRAIAIGSGYA
jgi:serine protease